MNKRRGRGSSEGRESERFTQILRFWALRFLFFVVVALLLFFLFFFFFFSLSFSRFFFFFFLIATYKTIDTCSIINKWTDCLIIILHTCVLRPPLSGES